jgi:nucleotide-binding universal stress UspA family protein
MKTILLPVLDDPGGEARLRNAVGLTRALGGHLTCLGDADAADAQATPGDEHVARSWQPMTGDPTDAIIAAASFADLVIASPGGTVDPADKPLAADLLGRMRTPILAVPPGAPEFVANGRILVGWNGSRSAIAAVRAAMPLLRLATRVLLVEIDDGRLGMPATAATAYLARHGVEATVWHEAGHDAPVAAMLCDMARTGRFDQIVLGAAAPPPGDGPAPGSVARDMMRLCAIPMFLAH